MEVLQTHHAVFPLPAHCSRSCPPMTLHGLTIPAALQLKAVLPQLSVPQSANAAPGPLTRRSSTCQPARPPQAWCTSPSEGEGGARGVKKKMEEWEIKGKCGGVESLDNAAAQRTENNLALAGGKVKGGEIESPLPLI